MAKAPAPASSSGAPTVEGQRLAVLLDIDIRHVREMGERGVMVRVGRNRYDFAASIRGYCKHLRELAAAHKSHDGLDNVSENALFTRERRRKLNQDALIAAGKLIPVDLVESVMADHIKGMRGIVLGFPNEAQTEMPHLTKHDLDTLRKICEKALRDNAYREIEVSGMPGELRDKIEQQGASHGN